MAVAILTAAGWRVDQAEDGAAAIAALHDKKYAVVLMDIQMPEVDGFQASRAIRCGGGPSASVPILAFTAMPRETAHERAMAAGMDGHVAKPFTPAALVAAVEYWRPGGGPHPSAALAGIFGRTEVASLLSRFRDQLVEALDASDDHTARRSRAHKIAGISGTLGFADVSRNWLAVSEGHDSAWDEARAAARRAIVTLDAGDDFDPETRL
ncbi:response regulator [Sphingomonas abietis]|uniref:Response regulator n=2 Tax=Sphingomonas abietis TaxID=3012344 RepID=A0ABY7NUG3_9SPHN|nr:response regulator [Sphingomonas abietis]